ncbi:MAG: hypothetical protein KDA93_19760 [Planctomycetaceae bacterium]|nr:hypothetical protein [Planctomycetaceae bacterium]
MSRDYVTLRLRFVRLQQDAEQLTERLRLVEGEFRRTGRLDGEIEGQLSRLLHDWDTLEHTLSPGDPDMEASGHAGVSKLSRLEERLDCLQHRERAMLILQSVQAIQSTDGIDSPELRHVHREMQLLEDAIDDAESGPVINRLVEGTHPANALLSLIRDGDRLSDKEWAALQETVNDAYGSVISTAAVRGRLTLESTTADVVDIEPEDTPVEVLGGLVAEVADMGMASDEESSSRPVELVSTDGSNNDADETSESDLRLPAIHVEEFVPNDSVDEHGSDPVATQDESDARPLSLWETENVADQETTPFRVTNVDGDSTDESIFDMPDEQVETRGPALIKEKSIEWEELRAAADNSDVNDAGAANGTTRPGEGITALPKTYQVDGGSIQKSAHAALTDAALYRDRHLSELILHLAAENRLGLAAYVARGQEARGELQVPILPSWLLDAMALAPHVTFVRGRLAAMLEELLSHCHERVWHDLSDDWREGLGFFVRAATLRPSVVSPGTRAAAILRSFTLNADCMELYNYCSRIATFGERLQGLMPALFTQRASNLSREDHLRALQAEVSHWSEMLVERSIVYTPAKQLFLHANWSVKAGSAVRHSLHVRRWQKWQQTLRLSENLIKPVREGDSELVPEVKAEIRRLSTNLRDGTWTDSAGDADGDGPIRIPHPAMKNVLREAMAFAQRWVALHSSTADEADFFLPQAAEELRDEVLERHDAVISELEAARDRSESLVVEMGVTCLLRAVHQLREMVDPSGPVSPSEADPRHMLSAELLKIPGMRLDDRWEPPMDAVTTQERILRFLADPQPDWQTAYQVRCESGDRLATERLLELDVWDSNEQKDLLREVRDQYIQPTRSSLLAELAQFERRLQVIADKERRLDDQQELENRLRRLRESLASESPAVETMSTIEWCRRELAALRSGFRILQSDDSPGPFPGLPEVEHGLSDDRLEH